MNIKLALFSLLLTFSQLSFALYGARPLPRPIEAVVSLHLNDPENPQYDYFCSGVLVTSDTVLTAGHCVDAMGRILYEQYNMFTRFPNLIQVKSAGKTFEVADVILSPTYSEFSGYEGEDLALIKLKNKMPFSPIPLLPLSHLRRGLPVKLVARGKYALSTITDVKTYATSAVILTEGSQAGVCAGDSGGALLVLKNGIYHLAGILSAQSAGCEIGDSVSIFPKKRF